ncbi:hypothetical protein RI367_008180, partial [Sorochytrium milnesiophthora]
MTDMQDNCPLEKPRRRHILHNVCADEVHIAKKVPTVLCDRLAAHHIDESGFLPEVEQLHGHILVATQQDRPIAECKH